MGNDVYILKVNILEKQVKQRPFDRGDHRFTPLPNDNLGIHYCWEHPWFRFDPSFSACFWDMIIFFSNRGNQQTPGEFSWKFCFWLQHSLASWVTDLDASSNLLQRQCKNWVMTFMSLRHITHLLNLLKVPLKSTTYSQTNPLVLSLSKDSSALLYFYLTV